ncbi:polyphosphate--glucose phosphotransferase [Raineyella fluvialis]|uniref:ROK family protein n=1 Tax=Raineyella fluvialis TaxID=2662261 RepID=A0A5Q2FH39_9ACTN|nr:ROK family protein [Raineyella fluvialis]QGF23636.1 ROK family protein [Raineyella fluvialis]
MTARPVLGIDIGGSGIKGAPVDLELGDFAADRLRIPTPKKSTPKKVGAAVAEIVSSFADVIGDGPVGITIPAVVTHGVTRSAANIDKSWIDFEAEKMFEDLLGRRVVVFNDADAAGLAEAHFGAAKDHPGLVLLTTLGTGIGTALIHHGVLIPNSEFGHLEIDGHDAETQASSGVKDRLGLSYKEWIPRIQRYFEVLEALLWPDLIVVGGGISRDSDKFLPKLNLKTAIVPAQMRNRAGIIGAAWMAGHREDHVVGELTVDVATERALRHAAERTAAHHADTDDSDRILVSGDGGPSEIEIEGDYSEDEPKEWETAGEE